MYSAQQIIYNTMNRHIAKKYFVMGLLSAILAAPACAQNTHRNKKRNKIETPVRDSVKTLTHTTPILGVDTPRPPKRKNIKMGHWDDSYAIDVGAFINMSPNDVCAVFVPNFTIKPFMRIRDKYTVGVHANAIVQNYSGNGFTPMVRDFYLMANARTSVGEFGMRVGQIPALDAMDDFIQYMPGGNYMMNIIYMDSCNYMPRAAMAQYSGSNVYFSFGYMENDNGFGFSGNGNMFMAGHQQIGDNFQVGGMVIINRKSTRGDIYIKYNFPGYSGLLFEWVNLGGVPAFYGNYYHALFNGDMVIGLNGFYQWHDGPTGANLGLYHTKSGAYTAFGATYHDPIRKKHASGIQNPQYNKWSPFIEVGLNKRLFPRNR